MADADKEAGAASKGSKKGRLSVERIYQKKSQLEHILLRPDTYIGSVQPLTEKMYVLDEDGQIVNREITYVPGLYKIFDEILVNAADNKQRDKKMDTIRIDIKPEENCIKASSFPTHVADVANLNSTDSDTDTPGVFLVRFSGKMGFTELPVS